jgi:hypothetical protein
MNRQMRMRVIHWTAVLSTPCFWVLKIIDGTFTAEWLLITTACSLFVVGVAHVGNALGARWFPEGTDTGSEARADIDWTSDREVGAIGRDTRVVTLPAQPFAESPSPRMKPMSTSTASP